MTGKRAILISNPKAGRDPSRRAATIGELCGQLGLAGFSVTVAETRAPGDAARLAAEAAERGATDIVVSGGDGTVNEALQGIVGRRVRLAVWATGTANVLARELGLPQDAGQLARVIARAKTMKVHPGCATEETTGAERYFLLMAGIGLDAAVVRDVNPSLKKLVGKAAFWHAGLSKLFSWHPVQFSVEVEGQRHAATFAAIGKVPRYGGGLRITPHARLDKPEFEICIVNSTSRRRFLRLLSRAMNGGLDANGRDVKLLTAGRARVTGSASVQVDGELIGACPMSFSVAPSPVEIVVP